MEGVNGTPPSMLFTGSDSAPTPPGRLPPDEEDTPKGSLPTKANARRSISSPISPSLPQSGIVASVTGLVASSLRGLANALAGPEETGRVRQASTQSSSTRTSPTATRTLEPSARIESGPPRRQNSTSSRRSSGKEDGPTSYFSLPFVGLFGARTGKDSPGGTVPGGVRTEQRNGLRLEEASASGEVFEDTSSPQARYSELNAPTPRTSTGGRPSSRASSMRLHEAVSNGPSRRTTLTPQSAQENRKTPRPSLSLEMTSGPTMNDDDVTLDPVTRAISTRQSMRFDNGASTPPASPKPMSASPATAVHNRSVSLPFAGSSNSRPAGPKSKELPSRLSLSSNMSEGASTASSPSIATPPLQLPDVKPKKTFLSRLGLGASKTSPHRRSISGASSRSSPPASPPISPLPKSASGRTSLAELESADNGADDGKASISRPKYIKVKTKNKDRKELKHLFLAQELLLPLPTTTPRKDSDAVSVASNERSDASPAPKSRRKSKAAIWAMVFSADGQYLAAAGQDGVVRVWQVQGGLHSRKNSEDMATGSNAPPPMAPLASPNSACPPKKKAYKAAEVPVFSSQPFREFRGHTADVLDLSWSKNNFLLSCSMDKTVRLWHVSRQDCLSAFLHLDVCVSVKFHPLDDRFFLSGSLDCKLRLWNVPEKKVHAWTELPELITTVAFSSDGKLAIAGSFTGRCTFFEIETFRYNNQLHARSGRTKKGKKVTSICSVPSSQLGDNGPGLGKVLVATNDSKMRLFLTTDRSCVAKYRGGHVNESSQIRASFSEDARYIITGSEDRNVYVYDSGIHDDGVFGGWRGKEDKGGFEQFPAESDITTCCIFAPEATQRLLARSGDMIFGRAEVLSPLATQMSRASTVASIASSGASSTDHAKGLADAIIVVAESGVIRVYRNSVFPAEHPSVQGPSRRSSHLHTTRSRAGSVLSNGPMTLSDHGH